MKTKEKTYKITWLMLTVFCIFFTAPAVSWQAPLPARISGTLTADNIQVTGHDPGYTFVVTDKDDTPFIPAAKDTDGLNEAGRYVIDISIYDALVPGNEAVIHVCKEGREMTVTYPPDGLFTVGSGADKKIDLVAVTNMSSEAESVCPLKLESVFPDKGVAGQVLEVTLAGVAFDENTRVSMYPDTEITIGSVETPGKAYGVTVSDGKAYVADDGGLQVIDIGDPENPVIIGSVVAPGRGVTVSDGKAYVADWDGGLQVIDIGDPENPVIIGSVVTPGRARGVTVSDGKAYVADWGGGLQVIDIGDPENPSIIGSVWTPGDAYDVTVSGGKAYVADLDGGLQVIDIGNPENPVIIGSVQTPGDAYHITVSGGKAYVACRRYQEWNGLQVIDIGNPENPVIIGSVQTPENANDITVSDGKAYVTGYGGLQVIDIGDPENPVIIGSVETPGSGSGVTVSDGKAYVADGNYGLSVLPLPVEVGSVTVNSETDISLSIPGPRIPGRYTLRVFNENESYELPGAVTFAPDWNPESGNLTMGLHGGIWIDDTRAEGEGYTVAAFGPGGDSDCRGKADIFNSEGEWNYRLSITADDNCEKITFKIWDSNTGQIHNIGDTIIFEADSSVHKNLDIPLTLGSVSPDQGTAGQILEMSLTGTGFDENTRVSMYPDTGKIPYPARSVAISDGKAYVAVGSGGLQVIDIGDPEAPVIIASVATPGYANDVSVSDGKAYVAVGSGGLQVIDIRDPENPVIIGSVETQDYAEGVTISDGKAYVVCAKRYGYNEGRNGGLQVIDIGNPENPVIIGAVEIPSYAEDVTVSDGKAYVAADYGGLQVIDINNPEKPVIIGSISGSAKIPDYVTHARDVTVSDGKAYVACIDAIGPGWDALQIIDIGNPENPVIIGSVFTPRGAYAVSISDGKAYVATHGEGLQVIDIGIPENPAIIGSVATPGYANDIAVSDGKAYVACGGYEQWDGLQVIDISDPENPAIMGSVETQSYVTVNSETEISLTLPCPRIPGRYPLRVFNENESYELPGAIAFVPDWNPESGKLTMELDGGVWIDGVRAEREGYTVAAFGPGGDSDCRDKADISDSEGEWRYHLTITADNNGEKITFKIWDSNAGQIHSVEDAIIFEADSSVGKNLDIPLTLGSVSPDQGTAGQILEMSLTGTGFDENTGVSIYLDTDNRTRIIGSVDTPGSARGVIVSDGKAYVADGEDGLQIINIGNPENPVITGWVRTLGSAYGVTVSDGKAYVADWDGGLQVIDIGDPENPVIIGRVETPEDAVDVTVSDGKAYVADGYGGLQVIDIANPENPVIISSIETPGFASGVTVSDGKAYVADRESGLQVVNFSNSENPVIIGSVGTPGYAYDVSVSDEKAYVADGESGLQVIDIANSENPVIIGSVETPGSAQGVSVSDGKAYVADGYGGLQVIDIGNPENPVIIDSVETPGWTSDVSISEGKAYVAESGLQVIDIGYPDVTINSETDISLTLPGPRIPGRYTLGVFNENENYELPGAIAFAPDWNPESGNFTMGLHGGIWIDDTRAEGEGYTVAAFGPGGDSDCRGKADILNSEGEWNYRLTVTADDNCEKITFKIWDSNTDQIHSVEDAIIFEADSSVGKNLDIPLTLGSVSPDQGTAGQILE
ncbi:hypothetical protein QUF80_00170, partial [Desulfococcaceae bacterium HSG8]|nr:hypothetical protein [Desulfococcaceae bacterium HSG8]